MALGDFHSNLDKEFAAVTELWSPRVVAAANGQYVKVAKVKGEFVWHAHAEEDEFFLVRKGTFRIRYRDRPDVVLREGNGPYILEMLTYRYRGHSMSDPGKYRSREEIQKMREEHDPIEQVRRRLLEGRLASEDELKKIDAEIRTIVVGAAEFAQNDAEPDESELSTDVLLSA